ncbi:uncharacterized protein LOC131293019 [Anopheles ziemanni]|uniref:uncharacterized protein LOC131262436 n=1 Tax=Anopheles coustani TaxID=139045 RepID=UPI00265835D2|nr:uncharacterized protein LOC131262436 [Anopheles coustani]XP_058177080.1 uncharacterized protein LOC131293019 [Anopheles ziemanni]
MERFTALFIIFCALTRAQEEVHLPGYLVFMKQFTVHVQIREPSGIMVWTRDSSLIEMFGIELHVGQPNHTHHEPIWDRQLIVNTSVPMDGKFMIFDHDLTIKKDEIIRYRFSVLHKGILSHSNYHRMMVTDHLFYRPKDNVCYSECLMDSQKAIEVETARLKTMLENKILNCVGSHASEHLFFPLANATSYVANTLQFVQYRLWQIEGLRPLVNNVVTTYLAHDGVGVKMKSVLDKLKVLELGRGTLDVVDFDAILQET